MFWARGGGLMEVLLPNFPLIYLIIFDDQRLEHEHNISKYIFQKASISSHLTIILHNTLSFIFNII